MWQNLPNAHLNLKMFLIYMCFQVYTAYIVGRQGQAIFAVYKMCFWFGVSIVKTRMAPSRGFILQHLEAMFRLSNVVNSNGKTDSLVPFDGLFISEVGRDTLLESVSFNSAVLGEL